MTGRLRPHRLPRDGERPGPVSAPYPGPLAAASMEKELLEESQGFSRRSGQAAARRRTASRLFQQVLATLKALLTRRTRHGLLGVTTRSGTTSTSGCGARQSKSSNRSASGSRGIPTSKRSDCKLPDNRGLAMASSSRTRGPTSAPGTQRRESPAPFDCACPPIRRRNMRTCQSRHRQCTTASTSSCASG